ncbi:MAG: hypothetical protein JXR19_05160 [Bacteroidia bacterium]
MRKLLFFLTLTIPFLSCAQSGERIIEFPKPDHTDSCYRIFNETHFIKKDSITKDELMSLDSFYFSKNLCTDSFVDTTYIDYFRIIIVPMIQKPSMITGRRTLTNQMKRYIMELTPGSRIFIEGVTYFRNGKRIAISPLIYTIKD